MKDSTTLEELVTRARKAQQELEQELDLLLKEKRSKFQYQVRRGRIIFERQIRRLHKRQRPGLWQYIRNAPIATIASAPIICGMILPLVFLDLTITLYQQICFRIYAIPMVRRSDYLTIDRHYLLPYLNLIEKVNCVYISATATVWSNMPARLSAVPKNTGARSKIL